MLRPGPRILLIRLSAIGDVVVTTPVSRALREAMPEAHLAWVVESKSREILEHNPYLDEVIPWDRPKGSLRPADLFRLRRELAPRRFDWAIDFQGNLRSALVARMAGARRIVGNRGAKEKAELFYHVRVDRDPDDRSSRQRCLDLLRPLGVESRDRRMVVALADAERRAGRDLLASAGIGAEQPFAALVPATTWRQKHWFAESWAGLAAGLSRELGLAPVLLGGPADLELAEAIRDGSGVPCASLAGKTSLRTAAAVVERARVTVSVDTALMHVSVAVGTPTAGLAGASYWPGFQDYENFALVREPMPCSPCLHRPTCGGRFDCMRALTPSRVLEVVRGLAGSDGPRK